MTSTDKTRRDKLYEQGFRFKIDRRQDEIDHERCPQEYTFEPNSGIPKRKTSINSFKHATKKSQQKKVFANKTNAALNNLGAANLKRSSATTSHATINLKAKSNNQYPKKQQRTDNDTILELEESGP